jgi:hypothetical protein
MVPEEPLTAVDRPNVPAGTSRTPLGTAFRHLPGGPPLPRRRRRCERSEPRRGPKWTLGPGPAAQTAFWRLLAGVRGTPPTPGHDIYSLVLGSLPFPSRGLRAHTVGRPPRKPPVAPVAGPLGTLYGSNEPLSWPGPRRSPQGLESRVEGDRRRFPLDRLTPGRPSGLFTPLSDPLSGSTGPTGGFGDGHGDCWRAAGTSRSACIPLRPPSHEPSAP